MRPSIRNVLLSGAATALLGVGTATAEVSVKLEPFVTGVNTPLAMVQPNGDDRLFVIEQNGRVRIVRDGKLEPTPFLDIRNLIVDLHHDFDERGPKTRVERVIAQKLPSVVKVHGASGLSTIDAYATGIIVSEFIEARIGESFVTRPVDIVAVKGRQAGIRIFELIGTLTDSRAPAASDSERQWCKATGEAFEVVVLDPPRRGLTRDALAGLARLRAERIVYVSCDPATLARDLSDLGARGYRLSAVRGFDLFPQTPHLEVVARLVRAG